MYYKCFNNVWIFVVAPVSDGTNWMSLIVRNCTRYIDCAVALVAPLPSSPIPRRLSHVLPRTTRVYNSADFGPVLAVHRRCALFCTTRIRVSR